MKILLWLSLAFLFGCNSDDRMKSFIRSSILTDEMKMYELNGYKAIELQNTCQGKKLLVIPSEAFDMPIDAGVGVNLCGSSGCVMYVVSDDGKDFELLFESNYLGFVEEKKKEGQCPDLVFESFMGEEGLETLSFNISRGIYERY